MALGAAEDDEMSGQMITRGWRIRLEAKGKLSSIGRTKTRCELYKYKGKNYRV